MIFNFSLLGFINNFWEEYRADFFILGCLGLPVLLNFLSRVALYDVTCADYGAIMSNNTKIEAFSNSFKKKQKHIENLKKVLEDEEIDPIAFWSSVNDGNVWTTWIPSFYKILSEFVSADFDERILLTYNDIILECNREKFIKFFDDLKFLNHIPLNSAFEKIKLDLNNFNQKELCNLIRFLLSFENKRP